MKTIFTTIGMVCLALPFYAQRQIDLQTKIISPSNGDTYADLEEYNVTLDFTNHGVTDIDVSDTIYLYMEFDGGQATGINNEPYMMTFTGISIPAGETSTQTYIGAFMTQNTEYVLAPLCYSAYATNHNNPITEIDSSNNKDCVDIYLNSTAKVTDIKRDKDIEIFPNPSKNKLHLSDAPDQNMISIYTINGLLIDRLKAEEKQLFDIQNIPNGIYMLKFTINGQPVQTLLEIEK